mmetsp:Transcript_2388/g.6293  ORF Transcript_2388/g.6293 Transcript_2388/m.6293 type:complete len:184 (-) Transcript_2388:252-803(-)
MKLFKVTAIATLIVVGGISGSAETCIDKGPTGYCKGVSLDPGEYFERGECLCDAPWKLCITNNKGKLQLKRDGNVKWRAGFGGQAVVGIDHCRQQKDGTFSCHDGNPGNGEERTLLWALNCGGPQDSTGDVSMCLAAGDGDVLNLLNSEKGWYIDSLSGCDDEGPYKECGTGTCECEPNYARL